MTLEAAIQADYLLSLIFFSLKTVQAYTVTTTLTAVNEMLLLLI